MVSCCCGDNSGDEEEKSKKDNYKKADYSDPNYEGEPLNEDLADGPYEERHCTDICCCLIFFIFIGIMGYIGKEGFMNGSPTQLFDLYDSTGAACGRSYGYEDYKYIYFWMPWPGQFHKTTCVKECLSFSDDKATREAEINKMYQDPTTKAVPSTANQMQCKINPIVKQCYGVSPSLLDLTGLNGADSSTTQGSLVDNMYLIYATKPLLGKVCFPHMRSDDGSSMERIKGYLEQYISIDTWTYIINDIEVTRYVILSSAFFALVIGFAWMVIMKMCVGFLTWLAIGLIYVSLTGLVYFVYDLGVARQKEIDAMPADVTKPYNYEMYISYGCGVFMIIMYIALCCYYKKIRIAIKIMETSADFVTEVCTVMAVPPVTMLFELVWIFIWTFLAVYVYSVGEIRQAAARDGELYPPVWGTVVWTDNQRYMFYVFVFGYFWIDAFIEATNTFIIASSACIWYFSPRDPDNVNDKIVTGAVSRSVGRTFCYHIGTLAMGSFILAVVRVMQLIMKYFEEQAKKAGELSKLMQFVIGCVQVCLYCFERIVKFINKNAYIQCAITSHSFCVCAKDAFFLILRNNFLIAIASGIGEIFIFVGQLFIGCMTTLLMYFVINNQYKDEITYIYAPLALILFIAFMTGSMFMSVWGMAADTILQCYCIDKELNMDKGKANQYTPGQLLDFIASPENIKKMEEAKQKKDGQKESFKQKKEADPNHGEKGGCCCC